ncbi:MAG: hypothetical protein JNJ83_04805, partial [Verrucomicrobiaceae bacterium]|nr:hypothetical protein [Verrucomicrobiaceae bacterium]
IQKQGDLIAQLLAEQKRLREAVGGTAEEIMKTAEENVAKANNQSVEDVRKGVQKALAEAKAEVAAAGQDKGKLIAALGKLIDAETAVGHENESIVAMQQLQTLLDRETYPAEWAVNTHKLLFLLKKRSPFDDEPIKLRTEAVRWARTSPKLGEDHPATLDLMRGLSSYLSAEDETAMLQTIARKHEKLAGPDAEETLLALRNLAVSLGDRAASEKSDALAAEADQLFKKVIGAYRKQYGPDSIQVANMSVRQSEFLTSLGEHAEAEKSLVSLVALIEEKKGAMEGTLIVPLGALVEIKRGQKDIPGAVAVSRRIVMINEKLEGAESDNTLASKSNLAVVMMDSDDAGLLGEAEKLLRGVLETRIRVFGASQSVTWITFRNLANCLQRRGKAKECIDMHLMRLEAIGKTLGAESVEFASRLSQIGHEFSTSKDEEFRRAGLPLLQKSLAIRDLNLSVDSVEIVEDLFAIGSSHLYLKEYMQAEPIFRREIDLREKYHPRLKGQLSFAYFGLFRIMKKFDRNEEAAIFARKALEHSPDDKLYQEVVEGLKPPAPIEKEAAPAMTTYADFRKEISDRAKAGKLTTTKVNLPVKAGRVHYIEGEWSGDKMVRASEWNAADDTNGTFTFYYFNQHGVLMSIFRIREGTDVPVDGVKKATDTFNFFSGKLVGWKRTQDDAEKVEDPASDGFLEIGAEILEAAEKATAEIIEAGPP